MKIKRDATALSLAPDRGVLATAGCRQLARASIVLIRKTHERASFSVNNDDKKLHFSGGSSLPFDVLYPMTGGHACFALAIAMDVRCDKHDGIKVGSDQQTNIRGLYASGDVVCSLN